MSADAEILNVHGLESGYGAAMVLKDLDLSLRPGEVFAILGKNGMGKSTLLKTLMGLIRPKKGRVSFFGEATESWSADRIARHQVAYIPQEQALAVIRIASGGLSRGYSCENQGPGGKNERCQLHGQYL